MADDDQPGCSRAKQQKLVIRNRKCLSHEELEYLRTHSDSEEELIETENDDQDESSDNEFG